MGQVFLWLINEKNMIFTLKKIIISGVKCQTTGRCVRRPARNETRA